MTEQPHFHFSLSCIGEGNGNPLQCSCVENPRDRGAWWAAIHDWSDLAAAAATSIYVSRKILFNFSGSNSRLSLPTAGYTITRIGKQGGRGKLTSCIQYLPGGSVVNNPPDNAGVVGSILRLGRFPGEGNGNLSSILAWEIPWTEEPAGLQSRVSQRLWRNLVTKQQEQIYQAFSRS